MATKIRLTRCGRKNRAYYRVVVADSRCARDGKFIEIIGTYQPVEEPPVIKIDEERALKWLMDGAKPSDTVRSLMHKCGILEKFHQARYSKKEELKADA
jgi:small subunit ribosomal protein S16